MAEACCFVYTTSHCAFYNLTPHNLQPLGFIAAALMVGDVLRLEGPLGRLPAGMPFRQFANLPRLRLFLTPVEFYRRRTRGSDAAESVSVDCYGYRPVTNAQYLALARATGADCLVALTEEIREDGGKKSLRRALGKTTRFLDESIALQRAGELPCALFAPFLGDFHDDLRAESAAVICARRESLQGVVLTGLHFRAQESTFAQRRKVYAALPAFEGLELLLSSDGGPAAVLEARWFGVRSFETAFPFREAEKGRALLYDARRWRAAAESLVGRSYQLCAEDLEPLFARTAAERATTSVVALSDAVHAKSTEPLLAGCGCYACRSITRAYVHHLLCHNEMTGTVLLVIHNCWVYKEFLAFMNSALFEHNTLHAIFAFFELFL